MGVGRFDSLLLLSFGGPEGPDEVLPFLRNVTSGRGVPDDRLAVVAEQYARFGGKSPINDLNRQLLAAVEQELAARGHDLPAYWGNRNWHPFVSDTVGDLQAAGCRSTVCLVTSAFSSYSGCRQYREDLNQACATVSDAPESTGTVEPGTVVTATVAGGEEVFLLGNREIASGSDLDVYSEASPLGAAILGLKEGDTTSYTAPNGREIAVEIVKVETYTGQ